MQRASDVPLEHLRAVAQHHQRGDGAEAAGLQVNGGAVVYFAIDHCIHQPHDLGGKLGHRRRGLRVVLRAVVARSEVGGSLFQVHHLTITIIIIVAQFVFQVGLVGTQIQIVFIVVFSGHGNASP